MRAHRLRFFAAVGFTAAVLAGCSSASHSSSSQGKPVTLVATQGTGLVPVVACRTTRGAPREQGSPFPMQLPIGPNSMADVGRLAYFTDDARELTPVLAPRGWQCSAEIGADGGSSITVFPQGTTATGTTKVSGQAEPACQGCVYRLVCPYIPAAKQQLGSGFGDCDTVPQFSGYSYGGDSPTATGATDDVVELSGSAPSYAEGVLLYRWRHNRGGAAALETCQLPLAEATMCGAITDDFQTRNAASY